jgi:hypothetical protein
MITIFFIWGPSLGAAADTGRKLQYITSLNWLLENTLNYTRTLSDKHNFEALVGYSIQKATSESSSISASQYPDDEIEYGSAFPGTMTVRDGSQRSGLHLVGLFM